MHLIHACKSGSLIIHSRILIVDDRDVVLAGVCAIFWRRRTIGKSPVKAVQLYRKLKPDAVVMDITMPVINGLDATTEIVRANPDLKALILTMHENGFRPMIERSGAKGLVIKSRAMDELAPALQRIIAGQTYFH